MRYEQRRTVNIPVPGGSPYPQYVRQEKQVAELMKHTMTSYGFDEVNIDKYGSVLGLIHGSRPAGLF